MLDNAGDMLAPRRPAPQQHTQGVRRPRVRRPQGTNPRGLSIPWLACVYSFA